MRITASRFVSILVLSAVSLGLSGCGDSTTPPAGTSTPAAPAPDEGATSSSTAKTGKPAGPPPGPPRAAQ